ncbi:MAG: methylated-DNA--[protein]-cysteine S-methyltransferase [Candidatus Limnocylindrus sp.]|jgi:O-6-methylguanine DNA methyltransferase
MGREAGAAARTVTWHSPWGPLPVLLANGRIRAISLDPRAAAGAPATAGGRHPLGPIRTAADVSRLMRRAIDGTASAREIAAACDISGSSPFERKVLKALAKVRRGRVVSYGQLAAAAGSPRAARAVGSALGKNPIPILLPCHRVVAANGIGGYGGAADRGWRPGGRDPIAFKRALLASEGVLVR